MRLILAIVLIAMWGLYPVKAAQKIEGIELVFGETSMVGERVELIGCGWKLAGISGMNCAIYYNNQLLTSIWVEFDEKNLPVVRQMLDHCFELTPKPRCYFPVEAEVEKVGKRPSLVNAKLRFQ